MNRNEIAELLKVRLERALQDASKQFAENEPYIGYFVVDDLLPDNLARNIYSAFPNSNSMKLNKTLREYKYIAAQLDNYNQLIEEVTFAFHSEEVVCLIEKITGILNLKADSNLYAGGISMMGKDHYLNPHLDNSHDKNRENWRVLNLLYYVSPDWKIEDGGNLELWPSGITGKQITLESKFNRLIVMATHDKSWHSVSPITIDKKRCCVSNYYFSEKPLNINDKFHITAFRGRPEQKVKDVFLRCDAFLRNTIRKAFPKGVKKTDHYYKK
ncbi:2OG-Fe(II) oxygenase [Opacimonas viscosa]|uniref:2OG-Fe(II) oxygenase n=1 Tax=Opacimonas viscosa TaxID=2961944 RepID=A0AA42BLQ5_9ALTE|nr:2OG-Fe(II) oxygenase [Opacimonas viscosa]MCP3429113.1 2OG-Fe(II) oxygenase [Opacimonas viscosa]